MKRFFLLYSIILVLMPVEKIFGSDLSLNETVSYIQENFGDLRVTTSGGMVEWQYKLVFIVPCQFKIETKCRPLHQQFRCSNPPSENFGMHAIDPNKSYVSNDLHREGYVYLWDRRINDYHVIPHISQRLGPESARRFARALSHLINLCGNEGSISTSGKIDPFSD